MIMSVGCERQIGNDSAEVQHRRELYSELAGRMHRNTELKRLANAGSLHASTNAAPERRVQQHHVDRSIQNVCRELFEIPDDGVRRERHANLFADAAHSVHPKHWIFKIIVAKIFDLLSKPDRRFSGPDAIRIETEAIAGQGGSKRAIAFKLIFRRKDTAFQLVRSETITLPQRLRRFNELLDRSYFFTLRVRITKKQVRSERHSLAQTPTKNLRNRHAPLLSDNIKTRKLERRKHLRAVVVERSRRIADQKSQLFELRRVMADNVTPERMKRSLRRLASAAHLTQADDAFIRFDFDDCAHKPSPVTSIRMTQRRLNRNSDSRSTDIADFHL